MPVSRHQPRATRTTTTTHTIVAGARSNTVARRGCRRAGMMTQPIRIAVVNSHPIQYFAPLYAYLNRDPALEVTALYCSDFSLRDRIDPGFERPVTWDIDLLQGYPHVFVGSNNDRGAPRGFWSLTCPRIWSEIRS